MDTVLNIGAWILIGTALFSTVAVPAMFGEPRGAYSFKNWLLGLPFVIINVIILLRFLGVI